MARLAIRRVRYEGDFYKFDSPELQDGIVIVEGSNGTGKTTFADLIYFGLGGNPQKFQLNGTKRHAEIAQDRNNFVELVIIINESRFKVKRYIGSNEVLILSQTETLGVFPIARRGDAKTYSDWILENLGIEPFALHHSGMKGKINVSDLLRLVYYDQPTHPELIYKKLDNDSTLVTDSINFRKAVFELLIGQNFGNYYSALDDLKMIEKDLSETRGAVAAFTQVFERLDSSNDWNIQRIEQEITVIEDQLVRLTDSREKLRASKSVGDVSGVIPSYQKKLEDSLIKKSELLIQMREVREEMQRLQELRADLISEVIQIKKIMYAHEQLNLFSEDTCPYCLGPVHRKNGSCICGAEVDEASYAKFFYSTSEYMGILKSKQKNVETIEDAVRSCQDEEKNIQSEIENSDRLIRNCKAEIKKAVSESASSIDLSKLEEIDNKILEIRTKLDSLHKHLSLERKRQVLEDKISNLQNQQGIKSAEVDRLGAEAREQMIDSLGKFNDRYNELLCELIENCRRARLDAKYMPVVNDGDHIQASAVVPIRMMYFLTLLSLSLDEEINFPRFILMDTPDTAGIDDPQLKKAIAKIPQITKRVPVVPYQVILTTGVGLFPDDLADQVVISLSEEAKLLKKK